MDTGTLIGHSALIGAAPEFGIWRRDRLGSLAQRAAGATLDHQAQQGMRPADRAGPVRGDLMIAIGKQPQHNAVLVETTLDVQGRVVPGADRRRTGIVRVGLVGVRRGGRQRGIGRLRPRT